MDVNAAILTEFPRDVIEIEIAIEIGIESSVTDFRFRSRFDLVPVSALAKNNFPKAIESVPAMLNTIQRELLRQENWALSKPIIGSSHFIGMDSLACDGPGG